MPAMAIDLCYGWSQVECSYKVSSTASIGIVYIVATGPRFRAPLSVQMRVAGQVAPRLKHAMWLIAFEFAVWRITSLCRVHTAQTVIDIVSYGIEVVANTKKELGR